MMIPILLAICYLMCPNGLINQSGIGNTMTPQGVITIENTATNGFVGIAILMMVFIIMIGTLAFSGVDFLDATTVSAFVVLMISLFTSALSITTPNTIDIFAGLAILAFFAQMLRRITDYF